MTSKSIAIVLLVTIGILASTQLPLAAQSAQPAPPTITQCDTIAQAGAVIIYRCVPESGPSFLVNSIGFMTPEE